MKKKYLPALMLTAFTALTLTSCGHSKSQDVYKLVSGGKSVVKISMTAYGGKITALSFNEVLTPGQLAQLTSAAASSADSVKVTVDGTDYYYAHYISVGGYVFEGIASYSDNFVYTAGDYVDYIPVSKDAPTVVDATMINDGAAYDDSEDYVNSLFTYLQTVNTDDIYNTGTNAGWYYEAVAEGKFLVLSSKTATTGLPLSSTTVPGSAFKGDEAYTGSDKATWTANMGYMSYFIGKVFYSVGSTGAHNIVKLSKGTNGYWMMNLNDEDIELADRDNAGTAVDGIPTTFTAFNFYYSYCYYGFQVIEKASYGAY